MQRVRKLNFFRSRFFWKLFLTYVSLFLIITAIIGWQAYDHFQLSLNRNLMSSLEHKLTLLMPLGYDELARTEPRPQLQPLIEKLGKETETRITLISSGGRVFADSNFNPSEMDDHSRRPEVLESEIASYGSSRRQSDTLHLDLVYLAKAVKIDDRTLGYVRVAWPESRLSAELASYRLGIVYSAALGLALALILALLFARRVAVPITEMVHVCNAMRRGNYNKQVKTLSSDEIGRLGDTLNRLGGEITNKISQISLERAQLKTILTGMVEGIIAIDNDQRVRFCNRAAYTLLGSDLSDARGMKLEEVPGFDLLATIAKQAQGRRELVEEELTRETEASSRRLDVHASFFEGIDTTGVIILIHDVTKVRNLERIRRDFVANVSHEIKTPLTSIKGYVETLLSAGADESPEIRMRFLQKIDRNADRLLMLVRDILSLARIESPEEELGVKPIDWVPLANQVLVQYEDTAAKKGLEIEIVEEAKPLVVLGDKEAMFQVVDNLVTNAIRYTPQGGKISIHLRRNKLYGLVHVSDTGIGIPRKYLPRIFERFYRVDKARSRELGGTGLGLSIVKHLVSTMGGKISVESEVGLGSTFEVSLPLAR